VAVFVDGCFWHGCPEHRKRPVTNSRYWNAKIEANIARDLRNVAELCAAGWETVRIWEHEAPSEAAALIESVVVSRRLGGR
jgi:DNA mismatch endonuclease (patch repair protein)